MTLSEASALPGWPYLVAAVFAYFAYTRASLLPDDDDEDYISEKYTQERNGRKSRSTEKGGSIFEMARVRSQQEGSGSEEYIGLLSEIEEDSDEAETNLKHIT